MAIKVIGVTAERAVDDGATTQDFLLVNSPTLPFGTVHAYAKLQALIQAQPARSDDELRSLGRRARVIAAALRFARRPVPAPIDVASASNHHLLGETFHPWPRCATETMSPRSVRHPRRRTSAH